MRESLLLLVPFFLVFICPVIRGNDDTFSYIGHLLNGVNTSDKGIAKETYKAFKLAALLVKDSAESDKFFDLHSALRHKLMVLQKIATWKKQETEYEAHKLKKQSQGIAHALEIIDSYTANAQQSAKDQDSNASITSPRTSPRINSRERTYPHARDESQAEHDTQNDADDGVADQSVSKQSPASTEKHPHKKLRLFIIRRKEGDVKAQEKEILKSIPSNAPELDESSRSNESPSDEQQVNPVSVIKPAVKRFLKKPQQLPASDIPSQLSSETAKPQLIMKRQTTEKVCDSIKKIQQTISKANTPSEVKPSHPKLNVKGVDSGNSIKTEQREMAGNSKDALELLANYFG